MTDTTPDYADIVAQMFDGLPIDDGGVSFSEVIVVRDEAVRIVRTLLESNAELERERDAAYAMQKRTAEVLNDWKSRAETAEARVKQLERLTGGIDYDRRGALDLCLERNKQIAAIEAERDRLAERVAQLEKGLEPFAAVAEWDIGDSETDDDIFRPMDGRNSVAGLIRVGHLRAARSLVKGGGDD